jgi:hypothetical protein
MNVVVFSKDRACQLDALLQSIQYHAPQFHPASVLYLASTEVYRAGYCVLMREWPRTKLVEQRNFKNDLLAMLDSAEPYTVFFVDDDVFFRDAPRAPELEPGQCYSYRLGLNVVRNPWNNRPVRPGMGDFTYSHSVDGHVFRTAMLIPLLRSLTFDCPNRLEALMERHGDNLEVLFSDQSCLVGIPHNVVQTAWPTESGGCGMGGSAAELNDLYLRGERIDLGSMDFSSVDSTHCKIPYVFHPTAQV